MFEMDAWVGVEVLGLTFMKGDQPHAGFPEAAYHGFAEQLARAGHRVVVVEQVPATGRGGVGGSVRPRGGGCVWGGGATRTRCPCTLLSSRMHLR